MFPSLNIVKSTLNIVKSIDKVICSLVLEYLTVIVFITKLRIYRFYNL